MNQENYLNHPNFGLLYRLCIVGEQREIFTTLYGQRLFFLVNINLDKTSFEIISRSEARVMIESRLRELRYNGIAKEYEQLQEVYQRTFQ